MSLDSFTFEQNPTTSGKLIHSWPIIHDASILNNGIYILRSIKVMGNGVPEYFNHFKNGPYPRIAGWTFYFYWENLEDD